jgi:hypothetical protein
MNNALMNWILVIAIVTSMVIIAIGFITSRNLPEIQKKYHIQKFGAVAVSLILFSLIISEPFISSYSNARHLDEPKVERLNPLEEATEFNKEQAHIIRELTEDVKNLRTDLYLINRFYGNATRILLITVAIFVLAFAFTKKEEEKL